MEVPCFEEIGEIQISFSTTFGTMDEENPFLTGAGTISGSVNGDAIAPDLVGAQSGYDPESGDTDTPVVMVIGHLPDETYLFVYAMIDPEEFTGGGVAESDWSDTLIVLVSYDPATEKDEMLGAISQGEVTFTQASEVDGGDVVGQISGKLVYSPFF